MGGEQPIIQCLDNLLFTKIFKTFRMAIQPSKLIIAFGALAIICIVGWIMDFSRTVVATPGSQGKATELQYYLNSPDQLRSYIQRFGGKGEGEGVFATLWNFSRERFNGALVALFAFDLPKVAGNVADYFKAMEWALKYHFIYCIIFVVIKLAVISLAGGAICRIAALQFARDEKPGIAETLRFGFKRFTSFFLTPLVPVGIVVGAGVLVSLVGVLGNIPRIGELIVGVLTPTAMLAGAIMAIFLIGAVAGFNLMFPSIAYDGFGTSDAISRSLHYVYVRPWRMSFYTAVAAVYGAICYIFVRFFAFLLLWSANSAMRLGVWVHSSSAQANKLAALWPEPSYVKLYPVSDCALNWSESIAAFVIYLCVLAIIGLLVSFIISFYFSANTVIYALLRNKVDNTLLEEIYIEPEQAAHEPAATATEQTEPRQTILPPSDRR
jgi:hypothetical protein